MTSNIEKVKNIIVDDEVIIASDLESRLNSLGCTLCSQASSGGETLPP
ncbi:MAG: hypothetical protein V1816_09160 [Pseudomonadota bacterium]